MREDMTTMQNVTDVCQVQGHNSIRSSNERSNHQTHAFSACTSPGPLRDHLGESKKSHDRMSVMGKNKFQGWVEKHKVVKDISKQLV